MDVATALQRAVDQIIRRQPVLFITGPRDHIHALIDAARTKVYYSGAHPTKDSENILGVKEASRVSYRGFAIDFVRGPCPVGQIQRPYRMVFDFIDGEYQEFSFEEWCQRGTVAPAREPEPDDGWRGGWDLLLED